MASIQPSGRTNNFDALRVLFAAMVILNHSYFMVDFVEDNDPIYRIFRGRMDGGTVAVDAFFAISGFLITLSWMRSPQFLPYIRKRVLRIYPGFLVCFLLSLLVVAPLAGAKWADILRPSHFAKEIVRGLMLSVPKVTGTFDRGHMIPNLNSSLWTIRYEFLCYLTVPVIYLLARYLGRGTVLAVYLIALTFHGLQGSYRIFDDPEHLSILGGMNSWPRFMCYYAAGMVMAQYNDSIPIRRSFAAVALAILLVTGVWTGGFYIAMATAGAYLLFYVAFEPAIPLANFGKRGDFSYGLYLYGWPIQQLLLMYVPNITSIMIFWCALPLTLLVAALSWHLIEEPCLRRKKAPSVPPAGDQGHLEASLSEAAPVLDAQRDQVKKAPRSHFHPGESTAFTSLERPSLRPPA